MSITVRCLKIKILMLLLSVHLITGIVLFVDALEAGKHVYVEKPIGNSIAEINIMHKAVKKHGKIVQVGQWQRSQPHFVDAVNYVKSGKLGRIRTCKAWSYVDWKGAVPKVPDSPVPRGSGL